MNYGFISSTEHSNYLIYSVGAGIEYVKNRLMTQCDHIHLNTIVGELLRDLLQDFIES